MNMRVSSIAIIALLGISLLVMPAKAEPERPDTNSAQQSIRERVVDMLRIKVTKLFPDGKVELMGDQQSILTITSPSIKPEMAKAFYVATKGDTHKLFFTLGIKKMMISNGNDKWVYDLSATDKLSSEEDAFVKSVNIGSKESRQRMVNELFLGKFKKGSPDLWVSVLDPDCTVIKITSSDFAKQAPAFIEECKGELKRFGFKKLIFSDGKTEQSYEIN